MNFYHILFLICTTIVSAQDTSYEMVKGIYWGLEVTAIGKVKRNRPRKEYGLKLATIASTAMEFSAFIINYGDVGVF